MGGQGQDLKTGPDGVGNPARPRLTLLVNIPSGIYVKYPNQPVILNYFV